MEKEVIKKLLGYQRIAVIGFSQTKGKPSYKVPRYLMEKGYTIYPVNPTLPPFINGLKTYPSPLAIEEEVDLFVIFRPSSEVLGLVEEILKRNDVQGIWLQEGITHREAKEKTLGKGLLLVEDRCIYKEHEAIGLNPLGKEE